VAAEDGRWKVVLAPMPGQPRPVELVVKGEKSTLYFHDVLLGEVWLCSGQSNMDFPLKDVRDAAKELAQADQPTIRLFQVPRLFRLESQNDFSGRWVVCTPEQAAGFSAAGFLFGRDVSQAIHVPVGLIGSAYGGSPVPAPVAQPTPTFLQPTSRP